MDVKLWTRVNIQIAKVKDSWKMGFTAVVVYTTFSCMSARAACSSVCAVRLFCARDPRLSPGRHVIFSHACVQIIKT